MLARKEECGIVKSREEKLFKMEQAKKTCLLLKNHM